MADVILSALPGSAQVQSLGGASPSQPATQQVPQAIAGLPQGALLKGFVVNRDAQSNPILRTELGDMLVKSDVFLKTGSEVVIRVNTQAGQTHARIVSVDNIPIKAFIQQTQPQTGDRVSASALASRSGGGAETSLQPGPPIQGMLLKPAQFGDAQQTREMIASILRLPPAQLPPPEKGLSLSFRLVGGTLAGAAASTTTTTTATGAQAATAPGQATQTGGPMQPGLFPPTTAPSGQLVSTQYGAYSRVALARPQTASTSAPPAMPAMPASASSASSASSAAPPMPAITTPAPASVASAPSQATGATPTATTPTATTPAASEPVPRGATLSARVIGQEAGGETIVRTSIGTIKLLTSAPPPIDSTLRLEVLPATPHPPQTPPMPDAATSATAAQSAQQAVSVTARLGEQWDSLERSLSQLRADAPELAQVTLERIPNTKSGMVNAVLFFLSALRGGDVRRWLGTAAMQKLDERNPPIAQRLAADFGALRTLATDQPEINWQLLVFPLLHEDDLQQARLFIRQDEANEGAQNNGEESRFVFEVNLSQLGRLQIDGLMHRTSAGRQLDLVIRSETLLEDALKDDIRAIYVEAVQVAGFSGQLRFAHGARNLLEPMQEIQQHVRPSDGAIFA